MDLAQVSNLPQGGYEDVKERSWVAVIVLVDMDVPPSQIEVTVVGGHALSLNHSRNERR